MCHQSCCACVSVEESTAAEECLLIYCKPVELYNILQHRGQQNPSFLHRCLSYKIQAKSKTRLMDGNVIFNYKDQNDVLRRTEVTREFSCPFCLMRCASFKGLRCHLISSHDLFKFEFWVTEEYRAINVAVKIDAVRSEIWTNGIDLRLQPFCFCSKPRKRIRAENPLEKAKYVHPHIFELGSPMLATEGIDKGSLEGNEVEEARSLYPCDTDVQNSVCIGENYCRNETSATNCLDQHANFIGVSVARAQSSEDMDGIPAMSVDQSILPPMMPNAKTRKLSLERSDPRSCALLQKRQFFHSHRAQEQVLSDRDSEDEVDDDIADLEDRRMLDDFVDVTKDEKHLMHLWNSFVRKQRVLADGHVPWACEAFLQLHGKELVQAPALFWCWRLFMIKLWNHGLLDACTMNNCSLILQQHQTKTCEDRKGQVG
ncbi:polycomb group protein [Ancistrocladus abbreviatus]